MLPGKTPDLASRHGRHLNRPRRREHWLQVGPGLTRNEEARAFRNRKRRECLYQESGRILPSDGAASGNPVDVVEAIDDKKDSLVWLGFAAVGERGGECFDACGELGLSLQLLGGQTVGAGRGGRR